jgi:transposase
MGEQYVGIDLHRRRSVIVRMTPAGEVLEQVRIENDPVALVCEMAKAGPDPEVVLEATYGWYWAADVLEACGAQVHLAHPLGVKAFTYRRVKNDGLDARHLADLLRMGRLPEAWVSPPELRELRELIRYRAKLVALRSGLKAQVHSVLAKEGVAVPMADLFGQGGTRLLDELRLGRAYDLRVRSLRLLIEAYDTEITPLDREITRALAEHPGYLAIQAVPGIGRVLGAIFVAEIGDVRRFLSPPRLCSWAGLTPRHHESDDVVHRGHITKQGSKLVRWAAVEAVQRLSSSTKQFRDFHRIADRRGKKIGRVAVARKLLTLVYYGLRDGEIRCLKAAKGPA